MFSHGYNSNKVVIFPRAGTLSEAARHLSKFKIQAVFGHGNNGSKVVIFPKAGLYWRLPDNWT